MLRVKTPYQVLLLPRGVLTLELKGLSLGKLISLKKVQAGVTHGQQVGRLVGR